MILDSNDLRNQPKLDWTEGETFRLNFVPGSAELQGSQQTLLADLANRLIYKADSGANAQITGQSNSGIPEGMNEEEGLAYNLSISRLRVQAVQAQLLSTGVRPDQLLTVQVVGDDYDLEIKLGSHATQRPADHEAGHFVAGTNG